jgi:hypothetical protein
VPIEDNIPYGTGYSLYIERESVNGNVWTWRFKVIDPYVGSFIIGRRTGLDIRGHVWASKAYNNGARAWTEIHGTSNILLEDLGGDLYYTYLGAFKEGSYNVWHTGYAYFNATCGGSLNHVDVDPYGSMSWPGMITQIGYNIKDTNDGDILWTR